MILYVVILVDCSHCFSPCLLVGSNAKHFGKDYGKKNTQQNELFLNIKLGFRI